MATNYIINWSEEMLKNSFAAVGDSLNDTSTSLVLLWRDVPNWGETFNENLAHLLENFASNGVAPINPTMFQTDSF